AVLNSNQYTIAPLKKNQAVCYLQFLMHQNGSVYAAVHNTLISM
ncbi:unnamed protein product, partial [Tuber aestivum]